MLCFGGSHGDVLGADDAEGSRPEAGEEAFKAAEIARCARCCKGPWGVPVLEAIGVVLGVPTDHGDEGVEEKDEDQKDLSRGQPELGLAKGRDGENINQSIVRVSSLPAEDPD